MPDKYNDDALHKKGGVNPFVKKGSAKDLSKISEKDAEMEKKSDDLQDIKMDDLEGIIDSQMVDEKKY
jgi:hypothetical protein